MDQSRYHELAGRISRSIEGPLKTALDERKGQILGDIPWLAAKVVGANWEHLRGLAPRLAEAALEAILDEFGRVTAADVAELIAARAERKAAR